MAKVLNTELIPSDCGVAIEYGIPQISKCIDLLLSGNDPAGRESLIIVELKQWESATRTDKDGVVRTRFAGGEPIRAILLTRHGPMPSCCGTSMKRSMKETGRCGPVPTCATIPWEGISSTRSTRGTCVKRPCSSRAKGRESLQHFIAKHIRRGVAPS